jgi:ABC-type multidrug transport system ATPase subunit
LSEPLLQVAGLSKRFVSTVALNDLTVAAEPGEIVAVLVGSGSGKSTPEA